MAVKKAIDWQPHDWLKAQGVANLEIARQWGIPWGIFHREKQKHEGLDPTSLQNQEQPTRAHQGTPALRRRHTPVYPGTPDQKPTRVHRGTLKLPAQQPTPVHLNIPLSDEVAVRLLSLLPDLEVIVARERDRQRLLSTPIGTPRHTTKKTYVVDILSVDLIERHAQAHGLEIKEVVNLALHECFERRQYLPEEPA